MFRLTTIAVAGAALLMSALAGCSRSRYALHDDGYDGYYGRSNYHRGYRNNVYYEPNYPRGHGYYDGKRVYRYHDQPRYYDRPKGGLDIRFHARD